MVGRHCTFRSWGHNGHNEARRTQRRVHLVVAVVLRSVRRDLGFIVQAMTEEELITLVMDEAFYIHKRLGPGMLENVYKTCLAYRLQRRGLSVETERAIPVVFEDVKMQCGYRADVVVERCLVVEIKSIEQGIGPLQVAQVLTYLRFLGLRFGLILNFNVRRLRDGIRRVLNGFGKSE